MKKDSQTRGRGDVKPISRGQLTGYLNQLLEPARFKDYCPNGLQVEGSASVRRIVTGVSASLALINAAIAKGADTIMVHHGYFWRGEEPTIVGIRAKRIALLLRHDLNLYGFHLPLDVHPVIGNNAQLAQQLGWRVEGVAGDYGLIAWHDLANAISATQLSRLLQRRLGQKPLLVGDLTRPIRRVSWCTGAAQDSLQQAIELGADAFVSGEISERTTHLAREAQVIYAAAGHHATERFGVAALGRQTQHDLGVSVEFVDDPNPV